MKTRKLFIGGGIITAAIVTIFLVSFTPETPSSQGELAIIRVYERALMTMHPGS